MASLTLFCSCIQDLTSYLSSKVISYIFFFLSHFCGSLLGRRLINSTVTVNHFLIVPISLQDQLKQAMLSKISPLRTQAHTQRENEKQIRPPQTTNAEHKYLGFQKNTLAECMATSFFSIFLILDWLQVLEEVQNQPLKLLLEKGILQNKQENSSPKTVLLRDIQNRKQKNIC